MKPLRGLILLVVVVAAAMPERADAVRGGDANRFAAMPPGLLTLPLDATEDVTLRALESWTHAGEAGLATIFAEWTRRHGRSYASESEWARRFEIFADNLAYVREHRASNPGASFSLGLNGLADLHVDEFRATYLGTHPDDAMRGTLPPRASGSLGGVSFTPADLNGSDSLSWVAEGAVTDVKNQRACGSCWSFSTTGAIEGINKIVGGELVALSEQELVDCDTIQDHGCQGGLMDFAFEFVEKNGGLDTEEDYPYRAMQGQCDIAKRNRVVVSIDGHVDVPKGNESALLEVLRRQPVSIGIQANQRFFQLYTGGVFDNEECGTRLDHGVLLAGFGTEDGSDYFLMKNSWGAVWGEEGYMKMKMGVAPSGLCGLTMMASYPIKDGVDPPAPPPTPPSPPPGPEVECNAYQKCPENSTCCCMVELFQKCLAYSCCPYEDAVCCDDHQSCCPSETTCNLEDKTCEADHAGIAGAYGNNNATLAIPMEGKRLAPFHLW